MSILLGLLLNRNSFSSMHTPWRALRTYSIKVQLLLLLSIFGKIVSESTITTSCQDVSVFEGGSTTLSCSFSVNIERLQNDFKIELYTNKSNTTRPLLLCHWSGSGILNCYEHEGYKYGGYDGNTVIFHVLRASLDDTGKYACVLLSLSTSAGINKCNLTIQALRKSPSTSPPRSTPLQEPYAESDVAINDTDTFDNEKLVIIILGVSIGIIITLLVIVAIIYFSRRRSQLRKEEEAKNKTEKKKLVNTNTHI